MSWFALPGDSAPEGITSGPDGTFWFTDNAANAIGRIEPGARPTGSQVVKPVTRESQP